MSDLDLQKGETGSEIILSRNGWWGVVEGSKECDGKESIISWTRGKISVSEINGSGWCTPQASANLECSWFWRILFIHVWRRVLKWSWDCGIVQFAELLSPAPSDIRGPRAIGILESKFLQLDRSWLKHAGCDTHGRIISVMAEAREDGYSAVIALTNEPSGSLFPRRSIWLRWWHCRANIEIFSDVAAIAHVLKMSRPHLQAGVATKWQAHWDRNCWWDCSFQAKELRGCFCPAKPPCWKTAMKMYLFGLC